MALKTSSQAKAALTVFLDAKAKFKPVRKATISALSTDYLEQFKQLQEDSKDTKPLTKDFLKQIDTVAGTTWTTVCNQLYPDGGEGLTNCLQGHGELL